MKHTPWTVEPELQGEKQPVSYFVPGVMCFVVETEDSDKWIALAQIEAHARLIAAAPELLEACKRHAQGLRNLIEFKLIPSTHFPDTAKEVDALDVLIAKAEGRS